MGVGRPSYLFPYKGKNDLERTLKPLSSSLTLAAEIYDVLVDDRPQSPAAGLATLSGPFGFRTRGVGFRRSV